MRAPNRIRYGYGRILVALVISCIMFWPQFAKPVDAQPDTIRFESLSTEQGLSQDTVHVILQDRQGFMWFGTEGGLDKYDGYQFTVYRHDPDDPASLANNLVSALYEDKDGNLWVGTAGGLDRSDPATGRFTHLSQIFDSLPDLGGHSISVIFQDHTGKLWIGIETMGLMALDLSTNQYTLYKNVPGNPDSISDNTVNTIYEDQEGDLWIGTDSGLDRFDQTEGKFVSYFRQSNPDTPAISNIPILSMVEDSPGALWIGTNRGLFEWKQTQDQLIEFQHDPANPDSLGDNSVTCILESSQGTLWIGTGTGLDQFDRSNNHFIHYVHNPDDPHSLSSNSIRSIYEDRSNVLWIGTSGGLNKYARSTQKFSIYQYKPGQPDSLSDNNIWSIYENRAGILWIGTFFAGLDRLDRQAGTVTVYQNDPADASSLSSNEIRAILEDHQGNLWIGMERGGLDRFDPNTGTFFHYRHDDADPGSLSQNDVFTIYEDHQGRLWVGTQRGGLNLFNPATGTFTHYQNNPEDSASLSNNTVRSIYEDSTGLLWIGTFGGIDLLDNQTNRFTIYRHDPNNPGSLSNDYVTCISEDKSGTIWVGTVGGGLDRFDRDTQSFKHYLIKDGLPDDTVYDILEDADGYLWLSTNKGLSRFNPDTETFRNYDVSDGLPGDQFNPGSFFQSQNGEMFFGGTQGMTAFIPEKVTDNPVPPPVVITAFQKFNQTVQTDLAPNAVINLSYRDSFISFEFVALDYNAPEKNLYAYQMVGVDKDWVYAGTRRYASYTNLSGGDYIFQVKASNNDGVWNEQAITLQIHITPPFWQTWWFISIIGVVVVSGAAGGYRLRVRGVEARNRDLERQVEKRTHELAVLNSISGVVNRSLDLTEVLNAALDEIINVMHMDSGLAFRLEEPANESSGVPYLNLLAQRGLSSEVANIVSAIPLQETMAAESSTAGKPLVYQVDEIPNLQVRAAVIREGIRMAISLPLMIKGKLVGTVALFSHQPRDISLEEIALLNAMGQQVGMAVENARLYERAEQTAISSERSRLARELHDSVTQLLYSVTLYAEAAKELLASGETNNVADHLRELRDTAQEALREMRLLIFELHRPAIGEGGLAAALQARLDAVETRGGVHAELLVAGHHELSRLVEAELYNIAHEALNNSLKHAHADQVQIHLTFAENAVDMKISDNGVGFEPTAEGTGSGFGISGMNERSQRMNGTLRIESAPGKGTSVIVHVPLNPADRPDQKIP